MDHGRVFLIIIKEKQTQKNRPLQFRFTVQVHTLDILHNHFPELWASFRVNISVLHKTTFCIPVLDGIHRSLDNYLVELSALFHIDNRALYNRGVDIEVLQWLLIPVPA